VLRHHRFGGKGSRALVQVCYGRNFSTHATCTLESYDGGRCGSDNRLFDRTSDSDRHCFVCLEPPDPAHSKTRAERSHTPVVGLRPNSIAANEGSASAGSSGATRHDVSLQAGRNRGLQRAKHSEWYGVGERERSGDARSSARLQERRRCDEVCARAVMYLNREARPRSHVSALLHSRFPTCRLLSRSPCKREADPHTTGYLNNLRDLLAPGRGRRALEVENGVFTGSVRFVSSFQHARFAARGRTKQPDARRQNCVQEWSSRRNAQSIDACDMSQFKR
jgi:hypothetical protein